LPAGQKTIASRLIAAPANLAQPHGPDGHLYAALKWGV